MSGRGRGRGDGGRGSGRGGGRGYQGDSGGRGGRGRGAGYGGDDSVSSGSSGGRGRGGDSGGGRFGGGGGRGRGGAGPPNPTETLTNLIVADVTPNFKFYVYGVDASDKNGKLIDGRRTRDELFRRGMYDAKEGYLAQMKVPAKDIEGWRRVIFFEGSSFFSSRPIPGLKESLPIVLVGAKASDEGSFKIPISDNGDLLTVMNVQAYSRPDALSVSAASAAAKPLDVKMDRRCSECTKAFVNLEALMGHCKITGHKPEYETSDKSQFVPAPYPVFLAYCNIVLHRAMGERMARWGREYIDPKSGKEPERNGVKVGVRIFRAFSCEFGLHRQGFTGPMSLTLTVDLRAKVIRTTSLLQNLCQDRDPKSVRFDAKSITNFKRQYKGEVVICTYDRRCYSVVDLIFDKSPATLPVEGLGMSHADYFKNKKNIELKYPGVAPMVMVLGRNDSNIYLPAELVCVNELDPFVKMQLPMIASFTPPERHAAIEEMRRFLEPGAQKTSGVGGGLLPALGLVLKDNRMRVPVEVMSLPMIMAAGMQIPPDKGGMWAPLMSRTNYKVQPGQAVKLNVVLVYHPTLQRCANGVYEQIRDMINRSNATYRFGDTPAAMIAGGDGIKHSGAVEKHFGGKQPANIFVLDLCKPPGRQALDPAYSVVKYVLAKAGYLSQFVNFNTYDHGQPRDERRSSTILQGVARQVLSKCGVRVWWVNIPRSIPLPAVFVGVDVYHAPRKYNEQEGKRTAKESVAAVIVQVVRSHEEKQNSRVEIYSETTRRLPGQEIELGEVMNRSVANALKILKVSPASCVVWRDGVGDTTVNQVAAQEIPQIRRALAGVKTVGVGGESKASSVALAYIICQKRIATKFLSIDGKYGMPSGALVTGLQGPEHATFYINGTSPPYSTPKPARFIIQQMDPGFGKQKKVMAELSWALCHDYPNWTGPIKLPAPCQMAHKLAELAGNFQDNGESIDAKAYANRIYFL